MAGQWVDSVGYPPSRRLWAGGTSCGRLEISAAGNGLLSIIGLFLVAVVSLSGLGPRGRLPGQRNVWNQRTILGRARKSEMLWLTGPSSTIKAWPWRARMACRQCWALTWVTVVSPLAA